MLAALLLGAAPPAAAAEPAGRGGQAAPPASVQAQLEQAYALLRNAKFEEAVAAFQKVLEQDPESRTARLELAYLNGRMGRWGEAVKYFAALSRAEPENLRLRMDYAYALERVGALEEAAEQFQFAAAQPGEFQSQARAALEAVRERQALEAARVKAERAARRDAFLSRGYAQLRAGGLAAARQEFEWALALDPTNVAILKQLGYLALEAGNVELAANEFAAARQLAPEDFAVALQLGYLWDRLGRPERAEEAFRAATTSPDPRTRESAQVALRVLRTTRPRRFYGELYAAPLYGTRFSNTIGQLQLQLHWRPRPVWPVTFYLSTRITRDSRSTAGALPAVFSDNVALLGAGIRVQPRGSHLGLFAETNLAFNLIQTPQRNREIEPDYRVVLYYFRRWEAHHYGPLGLLTLGRLRSDRLFTDLDASLGYYSRYRDNVIGYLDLREGLRLANWGPSRLFGYAKVDLAKDTNRDFFNNVGEVGAGLEFRPTNKANVSLRGEHLRGIYYRIESRGSNPFRPQYNNFRLLLLVGHRF